MSHRKRNLENMMIRETPLIVNDNEQAHRLLKSLGRYKGSLRGRRLLRFI